VKLFNASPTTMELVVSSVDASVSDSFGTYTSLLLPDPCMPWSHKMEDALSSFHFLNTGSHRSHCPVPASTSRMAWVWYSLYGSGESHWRIFVRSNTASFQFVLRQSYVL
jgi:hypothetical protein